MPQSLSCVHIHLVFSTKNRLPLIDDDIRDSLHRYMAVVYQDISCPSLIINSVEDHIHALFVLSRTMAICDVVEKIKVSSSKWIKKQDPRFRNFAWQGGYGDFGVSKSDVDSVRAYIANQQEHHRELSFQDEYRAFLRRHEITYDERYVWD